jgi:acetyltransferase-like isoleucine patch superfamily enzyme
MRSIREFCANLAERLCESLAIRLVQRPKVAQAVGQALLQRHLVFGDENRVAIAGSARINNALLNVASGRIVIEDDVVFGHNVALLTGSHAIEVRGNARLTAIPAAGRDIIVRAGAWIASNATIVGPAVIGENSVVAAGAVVTSDVAANTLVAGVPARHVRGIDEITRRS